MNWIEKTNLEFYGRTFWNELKEKESKENFDYRDEDIVEDE